MSEADFGAYWLRDLHTVRVIALYDDSKRLGFSVINHCNESLNISLYMNDGSVRFLAMNPLFSPKEHITESGHVAKEIAKRLRAIRVEEVDP